MRLWLLYLHMCSLLVCSLACQTLAPATPDAVATPTLTQTIAPPETDAPARRWRVFEQVRDLVQENYVYPDYNGVDWEATCEEFAPLVVAAPDDPAFWQVMQTLTARLDDQHSHFLTPAEAVVEDESWAGYLDYVGIGIYVSRPDDADYGIVLFTFPGSPAEAAGLRAHERILSINGIPACCNADGSDNLDLMLGEPGTSVTVQAQLIGESPRELEIRRAQIQTQLPIFSRRIPTPQGDIAYLLIPTLWEETIAQRTRETLQTLYAAGPLAGLIIDMRINGGGAYTQLTGLLSLFTAGHVGNFLRRGGEEEKLRIVPRAVETSRELPLVVLIGRDTESYAEVFSGTLQSTGRALLIGAPSAGNIETIYPYDLEDGSRLWVAQETFLPLSGVSWEGVGLQPDILIPGAWENFTADADPQLQAALEYLQK